MRPPLSFASLDTLLQSSEWKSLRPNFPNAADVLPADISPAEVYAIGDAANELAQGRQKFPVEFPFGTLAPFAGHAEQKTSFRLSHRLGTMVVHVLPYPTEEPAIPSSRFLTRVHSNPTQHLYEYSDPRTYAMIPWSDRTTVSFQEYGGMAFPAFGTATLSKMRAERIIRDSGINLSGADLAGTRIEMGHLRHHLRKAGHLLPLLIDIPVVDRTKRPDC